MKACGYQARLETYSSAGGALIAKQKRFTGNGTNYDSIEWSTADPVTGTTTNFSFASYGNRVVTSETEPFRARW